ncbi:MAG: hypothetical protein K2F88_07670 [Duncaniella sp.]|nr:hypothetical protein [Duncaniella sp.]
MRLSNLLLGVSIAGALLTSCTADEIAIPRRELYAREFIKKFGVIDPNRNLNAARHSGINIVTTAPTDVKVYADVDGKRYLFARGRRINGTTTLKFDIPASVKEVIVDAGGTKTIAAIGSTVRVDAPSRSGSGVQNFSSGQYVGKGVQDPSSEGGSGITAELCTEKKDWMVVPLLNATIFRRKMPEGCYNSSRDGVDNDFMLKFKKNDIIIRPLYWQTSQQLEFGLFYFDGDGKPVHCPIYDMEKNTENEPVDNLALCWVPSETKSITIKDFMNDEVFMECLNNNGTSVIDRVGNSGEEYRYIDVYSLDNFQGSTTSICDRNMTRACREYLDRIGIKNDPDAPAESRFNYVYRWRMTGEKLKGLNQWGKIDDIYDNTFTSKVKSPSKDLEIVYTYYNYDYENKAKGWSGDSDMISSLTMDDNNYPSLISKGIKVHLDDIDKAYGGYIRNGERYLYSYSPLNEGIRWVPGPGAERTELYYDYQSDVNIFRYPESAFVKDPFHKAFRAVTWLGSKYEWRYMSFEDGTIGDTYSRSSCDFDMQDFVFILDDDTEVYHDPVDSIIHPDDPEPEAYRWLIAAEDLAGTYDWDFNDAVFAVTATPIVDGEKDNAVQTWITVEPLAAGGTLPIYVMFNGDIIDEKGNDHGKGHFNIGPELHKWLGGYYRSPINVDAPVASAKGIPLSFHVDGQWSLTDEYKDNPQWSEKYVKGMGGFYVLVNPGDGLHYMENAIRPFDEKLLDDENHYHMVTPPTSFKNGEEPVYVSPEMLCLEASWRWPMEEQGIHEVYYNFEQWLKDGTTEWYTGGATWDANRVVSRE